jgi:tetratricopeptide (TPR) repeat protein
MSVSSGSDRGRALRVSELFELFPRVPELAPLLGVLVSGSRPDAERRWTGSGELGTVGGRIVEAATLARRASELGEVESSRVEALWEGVAKVVGALARDDTASAVAALLELGRREEEAGRTRDAEGWFLAGHRLARDGDAASAPRALRLAARAARATGRLDDAAERYERAWRDAGDLDMEEDQVIAAIGRGNVAVDRGRWDEAREWYGRALARVGEAGTPRRERWQLLQNLAIVARRSGDLDDATELLDRAREEGERLADADAKVEVGNGVGKLLLSRGDARGAELHFRDALRGATTARARAMIGVNLGEALLAQGRALEAGEAAREAESVAIAASVTEALPETYRLLAGVARARAEGEAFVFLEEALDLIREASLPPLEEALTREAYGELRIAEGDPSRGAAELRSALRIFRELGTEVEASRVEDRLAAVEGESK